MLWFCSQAPQFLTFKDGKLGVNFGGYHAGVGIGGGAGKSLLLLSYPEFDIKIDIYIFAKETIVTM